MTTYHVDLTTPDGKAGTRYTVNADTAEQAETDARTLLATEHPGLTYPVATITEQETP